MNKQLKQKILNELNTDKIPDLKFLYSDEVLEMAPELLEELLKEEKKDFQKDLETKDEDITFELFQDFSILDIFYSLLDHLLNVKTSDKIRKIVEDFEPKLMDFSNEISYNKRYYQMLIYCLENCQLDEEQAKILTDDIKAYKVRWINLPKEKQEELKKINKQIRKLSQKMWNNVLDSENEFSYLLENNEHIKELPEDVLKIAQKNAEEKWKKWYQFDSSNSSYANIMKFCSSEEIRKHFYKEHIKFASSWKFDNREIILEILKLRDKKAKILGYKNYAELSLVFKMAESPEQVKELLYELSSKSKKKAEKELDNLKKHFNLKDINPWDVAFYNRKLKEEKYNFDEKELKKYFEFSKVQKGLFDIVEKLYNITLKEIKIESFEKDIYFYEAYKDWGFISYFIADYFYRDKKRSWAWEDNLRWKFFLKWIQKYPIIINVTNFKKIDWEKTLLTLSDVETMFHEFGHAIHDMVSDSKYSDLWSHGVEWDFIELPSQLLENWSKEEESLNLFAKHKETSKKIPKEIFQTLKLLEKFWTWNFYLWQSGLALLDITLHSEEIPDTVEKLDKIILEIENETSLFKKDSDYKQYASFKHIFDWWYASWYYSYIWAEIIEADIFNEFKKSWIFNKVVSKRFLDKILSQWSKKDAKDLFEDFMWRKTNTKAFFDRSGF